MKGFTAGFADRSRVALYIGAAAIAFAVPQVASAQDTDPAVPDDGADDFAAVPVGNEIVVTATKREQTLQDVPVAVSVTSAETLERAQIRDVKDLSSVVPSLRVNTLQSSANTNFYIRGFGNGANNAGIEPSVGLFVDGVYRSRSASMISDLPDVQRIEVLRGPQSTLFGKNASAGVISIVTRKPQFDFGGNVEATYGNFNAWTLKGVVTGPVTDSIAASISGSINKRDGFIRDLGTGDRTNDRDRWFVRGQLLFDPDSPLEVRIIGDYGEIDENCCAVFNLRPSAATFAIQALGGQVNDPTDPFADDVVYSNFNSTNEIENWGVSGEIDYDFGAFSLTSITAYRRTNAVTNQDSDFTSADLLGRNFQDVRIKTFTQELRLEAELADTVSFLLGGYYFDEKIDQDNELAYGQAFRPYANLLVQGQTGGAISIPALETQIGQIAGAPGAFDGTFFGAGQGFSETYTLDNTAYSIFGQVDIEITDRLTLTGGVNYTHDKKTFTTDVQSTDVFAGLDLPAIVTGATNAGISQQVGGILGVPGGFASAEQIAGFAQAQPQIYQQIVAGVSAQTQPLLGLRSLQLFPPFLNVPNAVEPGRISDGDFSYTANLSFQATDTINVYARYATGYKAASINLSRDSRPTPGDLVAIRQQGLGLTNLTSGSRFANAEESTLYEIGLKADWEYASANVAFFKQDIKGFQSNIFTGTGFFLANAGKQSVKGFEFEGQVRPVEPLTLSLALTYLDPEYDSFNLSAFGDLSGTTPAGVTPLSVTFAATYEHELASGDRIILRGDYHYEAPFRLVEGLPALVVRNPVTGETIDVSNALQAARDFKQDINDVNASITYAMDNGLELSVWGRNLLDDRTLLSLFDSPGQLGSISGYPNQPRTYGISARFRW
ncbi:TonB-dependent receptor [Novosphingobium marinum]|uniref:Outer membrane receptor protein involved in Fe transport n=1 Tax=Novosphingobium marinum TaxID=1514948 RepID=A0A7Z0BUP2_9SPHN|nr:TonB-dependent receptor [Novosphingobium marinum]NYH95403.1 outer membrane receptor protein involved in Fe transport [Novosphingobium marinum]GGC26789.1 TonB-dependent receptor [Novosphingobium marinum]